MLILNELYRGTSLAIRDNEEQPFMRPLFRRLIVFVICNAAACSMGLSTAARTPQAGEKIDRPTHLSAGWRTYRSPDYGFSIDYPTNVSFYGTHPDPAEMKGSYIPICEETTVACFEYNGNEYKGTILEAAGLSVNVLRDLRTEQGCNDIDTHSTPIKTETINGINFHYGVTGDAGLGHGEGGPAYRAFYQNVCFEIAVGIAVTNAIADEPGIKKIDERKLDKVLDEMVHTFRFIGDVVDGPAWKVYNDGECGGSFEYPDGDTVVKTIEYSQVGYYSNDITCSEYFTNDGRNYTVAVKVRIRDVSQLNIWLKSAGLPDLSKAEVVTESTSWTEYQAEPYFYVFGQGRVSILSVSDSKHVVAAPTGDRVFLHLVKSFRTP
jgi:hypothetical protein